RELRAHVRRVALEPRQPFDADLALDLQLAQLAEQRALLAGERFRFTLERGEPFGRALRLGFGLRAIRDLGVKADAEQEGDSGAENRVRTAACHRCRPEWSRRSISARSARC